MAAENNLVGSGVGPEVERSASRFPPTEAEAAADAATAAEAASVMLSRLFVSPFLGSLGPEPKGLMRPEVKAMARITAKKNPTTLAALKKDAADDSATVESSAFTTGVGSYESLFSTLLSFLFSETVP